MNVPNAVWIDEDGVLVRPSHPAHHTVSPLREMDVPEGLGRIGEMLTEVKKVQTDPVGYVAAIHDWAENGAASSVPGRPTASRRQVMPVPPRNSDQADAGRDCGRRWRMPGPAWPLI